MREWKSGKDKPTALEPDGERVVQKTAVAKGSFATPIIA
jgi:hypothetical protein